MVKLVRPPKALQKRLRQLREDHWPEAQWADGEMPWLGPEEVGYFNAPRSLPYVLLLLKEKKHRKGRNDIRQVYLDLLARHWYEGVVEMADESEHVFASGFSRGESGVRQWRKCMADLESIGLIKAAKVGDNRYGIVMLMHPTAVIQKLYDEAKLDAGWWAAYRSYQLKQKEARFEDLASRLPARSSTSRRA